MSVGDDLDIGNANWRFRGKVVEKFDEHVAKSVPLYWKGHELIYQLSDYFIKDGSTCYEIGCSTGELTVKLAERHKHRENVQFVGIDLEPEMVDLARKKAHEKGIANAVFEVDDAVLMDLKPTDFLVSYYAIQFIRPSVRQELFNKIYQALQWGGAFLLFEKVRANDARFQDIMTGLYTDFKLEQGFTAEEIVEKSRSLKGVLEPFSTKGNLDLLTRAGFVDVVTVMKYMCFEGFLAIK